MAYYSIAGLTVEMSPRHALTRTRAERYRCAAKEADIVLPVTTGDANEEYAELAMAFYEQLPCFDGFLLHASAVESDGKAVLFSATSGTGKSTHASYWVSELGASVLNDDKPAVRLEDGVFSAYGTPFCGKNDISENRGAPLHAVVVLRRAPQTRVERLSDREALFSILDQTLRPTETARYERLISLVMRLIAQVPVYAAYVANDPSSVSVVRQALGL